ncbi:hypothetical protein BJX96DRAFT_185299 [Aspergillus floccosus]
MDARDVSALPQYFEYLKGHEKTLQRAQGRKGQRARPRMARDETIAQFMFRHLMNAEDSEDSVKIRSSFLPLAYAPCVASLDMLSKFMIKDLCLEVHHRGYYLLLRTVTPTDTMTAVMAIVEDEEGTVLMLQLYNQGQELSGAQNLMEGTVLIVKEPYVKVMADGDYGIRVDHVSDVIFLPECDDRIPFSWRKRIAHDDGSSSFWKERGNASFNQGNYRGALQCYSRALATTPSRELAITTRLNRALTFLRSHQFDAALAEAETVLQVSALSEKALFRKAQALYYLGKFQQSCDTHKPLAEHYPENEMAQREFARASARLVEQERGQYEFKKMQWEATTRRPPHLHRGTYIGPVMVRLTQSHGKGLFTTDAVKAGDLLFCEKALAHAFHDELSPQQLSLLLNAETSEATLGKQGELIEAIVQRLYKNPSLLPSFADHHHGTYKPVNVQEVDDSPIIDSFLVERIVQLNCFGCPLLSRDSHIGAVASDNTTQKVNKEFDSCGFWHMASYINHSCLSNARRSFIGDMMIVRATQDLAPNTEVTFWYKSPISHDTKELPVDLQHWGFRCDCILCRDIQSLSKSARSARTRLLTDLQRLFEAKKRKLQAIEDTITRLEGTYSHPASEVPRLATWSPHLSLAAAYLVSHNPEKAVTSGLRALQSLGYVVEGGEIPQVQDTSLLVRKWGLMTDGVVGCWMILRHAYHQIAPSLEPQAHAYAKLCYKICVGEDETFDGTYGRSSNRADGLLVAPR